MNDLLHNISRSFDIPIAIFLCLIACASTGKCSQNTNPVIENWGAWTDGDGDGETDDWEPGMWVLTLAPTIKPANLTIESPNKLSIPASAPGGQPAEAVMITWTDDPTGTDVAASLKYKVEPGIKTQVDRNHAKPDKVEPYLAEIDAIQWEVTGVTADTTSGTGATANFRVTSPGPGKLTYTVTLKGKTGISPVWPDIGQEAQATFKKEVPLVPIDLAVDANRDGVIKFAGNYNSTDPQFAGKPQDKTTEAKPFRFWCNDDNDGLPNAEGEAVGTGTSDYEDGVIQTARDLEDFSRLYVHIGGFYDELAIGTYKIGLKWRNTNGTAPRIKVYKSTDNAGSDSYLKEETAAFAQVSGDDAEMLGEVAGEAALNLDREGLLSGYSEANPKLCLLFEGSGEGKGQLCITIHKADGAPLGEGPGVWLDLKNIKKMYVRGNGVTANYISPYSQTTSYTGMQTQNSAFDSFAFENSANEKDEAIIFVHGIHSPGLTNPEAIKNDWYATCETTFKRLWHQGYKGRFAAYKWAALTPGLPFRFNESEYRGWQFGNGLVQFANSIPRARKTLVAHSQGNVVCGEALRSGNLTVENYILLQAAVPGGCYDVRDDQINNYQRFGDEEAARPTPDTVNEMGYRGYLNLLNVTRRVVNFNNREDYALVTGATWGLESNWEKNQVDYKPNALTGRSYSYISDPWGVKQGLNPMLFINDSLNGRYVTDIRESMAFVARPRSQAAGALNSAGGSIQSGVDLNSAPYFFTRDASEHSGQWNRSIQKTWNVYTTLLDVVGDE